MQAQSLSPAPKMQGQVFVVPSAHDGKIALPQAFVDDFERYKEFIGDGRNLKGGDELTPIQFAHLNAIRLQAKQKVQQRIEAGWDKSETFLARCAGRNKTPQPHRRGTLEMVVDTCGHGGLLWIHSDPAVS